MFGVYLYDFNLRSLNILCRPACSQNEIQTEESETNPARGITNAPVSTPARFHIPGQ